MNKGIIFLTPLYLKPLSEVFIVDECQFYHCQSESYGSAISLFLKDNLKMININMSTFTKCTGNYPIYISTLSVKQPSAIERCAFQTCTQCYYTDQNVNISLKFLSTQSCNGIKLYDIRNALLNSINVTYITDIKYLFFIRNDPTAKIKYFNIMSTIAEANFIMAGDSIFEESNFVEMSSKNFIQCNMATFQSCIFCKVASASLNNSHIFKDCYSDFTYTMSGLEYVEDLSTIELESFVPTELDIGKWVISGKQTKPISIDAGNLHVKIHDAIFEDLISPASGSSLISFDFYKFNVEMTKTVFTKNVIYNSCGLFGSLWTIGSISISDVCFSENFGLDKICISCFSQDLILINRTCAIANDVVSHSIHSSELLYLSQTKQKEMNISQNGLLSNDMNIIIQNAKNLEMQFYSIFNNSISSLVHTENITIKRSFIYGNDNQNFKLGRFLATDTYFSDGIYMDFVIDNAVIDFISCYVDILYIGNQNFTDFPGTNNTSLSPLKRFITCYGSVDRKKKDNTGIIIGVSIASIILIVVVALVIHFFFSMKNDRDRLNNRFLLQESVIDDFG